MVHHMAPILDMLDTDHNPVVALVGKVAFAGTVAVQSCQGAEAEVVDNLEVVEDTPEVEVEDTRTLQYYQVLVAAESQRGTQDP
jgi:hypothetical protein